MPKDTPKNILVLGAGGFTIGIDDTFHQYTFLDIEKDLQNISEKHFLRKKLKKNKTFIVQDAYLFLINDKNAYDLILVDVYSSTKDIPMNFTTVDFFKLVKAHLKENGIMLANIITSANFSDDFSKRIDNTLRVALGNTLTRTVVQPFNPYKNELLNVVYAFYNIKQDDKIYTLNKNTSFYDSKMF